MDAKLGLYAWMDAPPTPDALIRAVMEKIGIPLPYADFLYSDVFAALTNGLTCADAVGKVTVNGVQYYVAGTTYYRPQFGPSGVYYEVVANPSGCGSSC